jgi:hypothetical protein
LDGRKSESGISPGIRWNRWKLRPQQRRPSRRPFCNVCFF